MRQVWQTEDGGIFDIEEEAQRWEDHQVAITSLAAHLYENTSGIYESDIVEVVEVLLAHYNVTPK